VSTQSEVERFFAGPPRPEVVNGRHKIVGPDGVERSYQRASNFAFPIVDQYGLNKHRMRQLLLGVAQRPDLMAVLATMDATDPDRAKLDEVIETATQVAGSTAAANLGTAIHSALQAADEGRPYPPEYEKYVQAYRAELSRNGLTVVSVERMVVHPTLGAAGRLDRVYAEADNRRVIGDVKTSDHLELGAHEFAVQLAVYQGAGHVQAEDRKTWHELHPGDIRDDYAIVVHVDRETGAVSLYRVDLLIGRHGANLAEQIRGWRKAGPVLLPYVPPAARAGTWVGPGNLYRGSDGVLFDGPTVTGPPAPQYDQIDVSTPADAVAGRQVLIDGLPVSDTVRAELAELDGSAEGESNADARAAMAGALGPNWTGGVDPVDAVRAQRDDVPADGTQRVHEGRAQVFQLGEWMDLPPAQAIGGSTDGVQAPAGVPHTTPRLRPAAELLKASTTKATVQQYCRDHGITEDLAHNKKILVEKLRQAGKLAESAGQPQPSTLPAPVPVTSTAVGGPPPPTGDPNDPRDEAFRRTYLARIKVATSVGELATIRETAIRAGGEQAWTAELTEAARTRVTELDQNTAADIANRIRAAQSSDDLAKLWEEVTLGGTLTDAWAPHEQAARARLTDINASRPPAPANPFAG
jgi:hypothetical protein